MTHSQIGWRSSNFESQIPLGTFNALFPKGNYFGVLATTGPGPINFVDIHPHAEATLPKNVSLSFDWIFLWRKSVEDGVYAVPGFLIRAADGSRPRYVGDRPGGKFGGKQIVICGFRETTESFLQDPFSSKRNRAGI